MIESIYILDNASATLILQHTYTGRSVPDSVLEYFQSLILDDPISTPPSILTVPLSVVSEPTALFSTRSSNGNLIILTPVRREPRDAIGVIELLKRITEVLESYFGKEKLGRGIIEANFDIVEELLGEMVDNGEIMTTEPDALRDIVLPPSLLNKLMSAAGLQGISTILSGRIDCTSRLSLTPDVTLTLSPASIISQPSFHPCVRLSRWAKSPGTVSFIPPDSLFTLLDYETTGLTGIDIPIKVEAKLEQTGEFEIRITPGTRKIEDLNVEIPLNPTITGTPGTRPSKGEISITSKSLTWTIPNDKPSAGMLGAGRPGYVLKGQLNGEHDLILPTDVLVRFRCQGWLASGVTVGGLRVTGTGIAGGPGITKGGVYKGVKGITDVELIARLQ